MLQRLAKLKTISLLVSQKKWQFAELGKNASGADQFGIQSGPLVFLTGNDYGNGEKDKIKFASIAPETISDLCDHVNYWIEIAHWYRQRSLEPDCWKYDEAMQRFADMEKRVEYRLEK